MMQLPPPFHFHLYVPLLKLRLCRLCWQNPICHMSLLQLCRVSFARKGKGSTVVLHQVLSGMRCGLNFSVLWLLTLLLDTPLCYPAPVCQPRGQLKFWGGCGPPRLPPPSPLEMPLSLHTWMVTPTHSGRQSSPTRLAHCCSPGRLTSLLSSSVHRTLLSFLFRFSLIFLHLLSFWLGLLYSCTWKVVALLPLSWG